MKKNSLGQRIFSLLTGWLLKNTTPQRAYLCDFKQICTKIMPGDVLLIEGRSRISSIIKSITQSPWSHAMLYIGRLEDIQDGLLREKVKKWHADSLSEFLVIESELGSGTIVAPLDKYQEDHIRILRPQGLSQEDAQKVIQYAISRLGSHYHIKHVIDLARFLLPWSIIPKKWGSYLFQHSESKPIKDICSSMIAEAFQSIHFPILPLMTVDDKKNIELTERNPRLFTPSDFDFSPYFSVIKYPIFPVDEKAYYHHLPWKKKIMHLEGEKIVEENSQLPKQH